MQKQQHFFWTFLGRVGYEPMLETQRSLRAAVISGAAPGGLILLEHPPTITIGRRGDEKNVLLPRESLARMGIGLHRVERGGDVTYHGPGQLMAYPVMPVYGGVHRFVRSLAEAARQLLASLEVEATWSEQRPGLWTTEGKIAAVGLHVSRGVAIHGLALNLSPDLGSYRHIVPCGHQGGAVTSVERMRGSSPPLPEAAEGFARRFTLPPRPLEPERLSPVEFFKKQGLPCPRPEPSS